MKRTLKKLKCFPDVLAGGILLAASLIFATQLGQIRRLSSLSDSVGPRFFPRIVLGILMVLSLLIIITGIISGRKRLALLMEEEESPEPSPKAGGSVLRRILSAVETNPTVRTWISILGIFFFILLMKPLGFAVSGAIYLFAQFSLLAPPQKRRLWLYAILAVGIAFGAYFIFRYAVQIPLPAGLLKGII